MITETHFIDYKLIRAATQISPTYCRGANHTVAAAARTRDGRIITGVNVDHFTGGIPAPNSWSSAQQRLRAPTT